MCVCKMQADKSPRLLTLDMREFSYKCRVKKLHSGNKNCQLLPDAAYSCVELRTDTIILRFREEYCKSIVALPGITVERPAYPKEGAPSAPNRAGKRYTVETNTVVFCAKRTNLAALCPDLVFSCALTSWST